MGGKRFKKGRRNDDRGGAKRQRHGEDTRDQRGDNRDENGGWTNGFVFENAVFDAFYKAQFIVRDEEWDDFKTFLQRPLPACFRLNPNFLFVEKLSDELMSLMGKKIEATETTPEIDAVSRLEWCPNAYKMAVDKRVIRKEESMKELHEWMKRNTENGNITRQEAVSMVPPLALNVSPHHKCLDLCAAPGSKTSQLLEIINRSLDSPEDQQGLIVANDCDADRAYLLTHQCRRINSPLLMITVHPGQNFPRIEDGSKESGVFDRVLCDVPCSGDGTLRKNPAIWKKWTTASGGALHPLQVQIATRGFQLTKSGGLMVYSTCSMSPYENESCVAEILRQSDGKLELIDGRQFLPHFRARPGLTTWNVLDDHPYQKSKKEDVEVKTDVETKMISTKGPAVGGHLERAIELGLAHYKTYDDVPEHRKHAIRKSMFPPSPEELEWMHLERCLRCLPQDEDTGGFFVATFRKLSASSEDDKTEPVIEEKNTMEVDSLSQGSKKLDWLCPTCKSTNFLNKEACYSCKATKPVDPEFVTRNQKQNKGKFQQKGGVNYHPWDKGSYDLVKDFYGFSDSLSSDAFYVRDDFNNTTQLKQGNSSSGDSNDGSDDKASADDQKISFSRSVYYMPAPLRNIMKGDNKDQLKIVTAGLKILDRKPKGPSKDPTCEYRILQEAVELLVDHVQKRKVTIPIQDFCNVLEGGLVSLRTMAQDSLDAISKIEPGPFICTYEYKKIDKIAREDQRVSTDNSYSVNEGFSFHAMCWKGNGQSMNVMCNKVELESMKHKFSALEILRPKISSTSIKSSNDSIDAKDETPSSNDSAATSI